MKEATFKPAHRTLLRRAAAIGALCSLMPLAAAQTPQSIRFAGEEWPPFLTHALPEDGISGTMLRAVLDRLGYTASIDYYPWKRTTELGLHDARYAGYVAVWRTPEREKLCHFSNPVGNTLTVLAWLKDKPVQAGSLDDLHAIRIGTVAGYSYGDEFDALVQQHRLDVEEGLNDEINLRKLLIGRFPTIVIERRVLRYLLSTGRFTPQERARIATGERLFHERTVHICFKRTPTGLLQQQAFNNAAQGVDLGKIERDYLRTIGAGS